jgi:hypothetical protein
MEHVVFYPSNDGTPGFERVGSLEAAVSFVEHLRNAENITEFSVHALTPVPLAFRAYYHVEVPSGAVAAPAAEPVEHAVEAPVAEAEPVAEAADAEPEPVAEAAPVAEPEPVAEVEVPAQPEAPAEQPVAEAPAEPAEAQPEAVADEDRSAEWVAEAPVVEAPVAEAPVAEAPAEPAPFADAPPVNGDVIPEHSGRRSMGFFAR